MKKTYVKVRRQAKYGDMIKCVSNQGSIIKKDVFYQVNFVDDRGRLGHLSPDSNNVNYPNFYLYDGERFPTDFAVYEEVSTAKEELIKIIERNKDAIRNIKKENKKIKRQLEEM